MSSYLQASPPVDASATVRGLLNTTAQILAGLKTFSGGLVATLPTADAADVVAKFGTTVADGSVNEGARLLSVRTGIGGTEKEIVYVRRPTSYGSGVVTVDNQGTTNTRGLVLVNQGAGVTGIHMTGPAQTGVFSFAPVNPGGFIYSENRSLTLYQNSNAYEATGLMKFGVGNALTVAATVPAFDFYCDSVLQSGQKLMRWKVNGAEVATLDGSASAVTLVLGGAVGGGILSVVPGSYIIDTQNLRAATLNATSYLGASTGGSFKMYCDSQYNEGRMDFLGTDSSASPGAATINRPTGKSAIASGATTCVITNSLVSAGSRVMVTFHGDHGAARWWVVVGSGSFTVTLSAAASANTTFSWEVSNLL